MQNTIDIPISEARKVFDFLEEVNDFFHQPMNTENPELVKKWASENYGTIRELYYDVVWSWLPPELQKRLVKELREASHQIIYTTHSPFFVDLGNWRGITRFDENGDRYPDAEVLKKTLGDQPIESHLDDIKQWRQHETIFFEADSELFLAQKVLLVEGPTDKYGIPRLADRLGEDLSGLTIVSCNGKERIRCYALLCVAYNVNAFVLFDLDNKPHESEENKRAIEAVRDLAWFTFDSSLEELLGFGKHTEQRAFKVLEKIDSIEVDGIADEIKEAVTKITAWFHR